jgi:hypothetical protein
MPATRAKSDGLGAWDEPDGRWSRPPEFGDGAVGLVATADDLLAFARMLLAGGGSVLSPESARAMCGGHLTDAQKARGGFGESIAKLTAAPDEDLGCACACCHSDDGDRGGRGDC